MAKLPSHQPWLTVKYITLHSGYSLVQELFKGRYEVHKETGRKERCKGDLTETLFACSGFETINILKYHTIKRDESPLLHFPPAVRILQSMSVITQLQTEINTTKQNTFYFPPFQSMWVHNKWQL